MLAGALASLVSQTRPADEVVVVDNNSTDDTRAVAASFGDKLPLKYVLETKKGVAAARNAGIKASTGGILAFTDDDCVADKDWLRHLEAAFTAHPLAGLIGGEILPCRHQGTLVEDYAISDALMRVGPGQQEGAAA